MQRALYALVALFVLILAGGFAAPRFARVEVAVVVDSPASIVFAQADDLRRLTLWASPILDDPNATLDFEGPKRGGGAGMAWRGPVSGSGRLRIVESIPFEYVSYLLNPGEPGEAVAWVDLEATTAGTRVTRGFEHDYGYNLVGRYFGLLWSGVVRRDYILSLGRLKTLVEDLPRIDYADLEIVEAYVESRDIAYVVTTAAGATATSRALGDAYMRILAFLAERGLRESGPPLAIFRGAVGARQRIDAAVPLAGLEAGTSPGREVRLGKSYEGHVVATIHRGGYAGLPATHRKLAAYLAATGLRRNGDPWEVYVNDPGRTPETELETEIVYPVLIY